ncbi:DsbA family protein [Sphingobacterium haloxyli]|uniref:DsbA family protein n=1 Tax=Sphingobacterium haloxyli TaxID=2100533 RepID=A0A2S9J4K4_9SPHI|nr:DsbA family protein [Sphingobacterium haloxyli]PRD47717.1 DsbA family protein [Sphingobacterium haloxyli]
MNSKDLKLIYIWDAYCGWCYGFSTGLNEFHKMHPELPITVLSGGLFVGDRKRPISDYPHIPGANQRIEQLSGVKFGDAYQELLEKGNFVLDSEAAAKGFAALEHFSSEKAYELAAAMQKAFYSEGKSLSEEATFREIADAFGLDADEVIKRFKSDEAGRDSLKAFHTVHNLGVNSYPTLLLQKGEKLIKIGGGAMSAEKLEENFRTALQNDSLES